MDESHRLKNYKPSRFKAADSIYKKRFADSAVFFISQLSHGNGKWRGQPFELIDWQEQIIRDLFGIVSKYDETRQFRTAYIEIPKKQGKTELAAAVALLLTCTDLEFDGEIYGCACNRNQASQVFRPACGMVEHQPHLASRVDIVKSQKVMTFKPLNSFYQVVSADSYSKHGINAHGIIFDELHAQRNRDFFDVMTKGSGDSREQPLTFIITTAGNDRNSIGWEVHEYAADILAGRKIDPTFYPVIYAADEEDDWESEETWRKANPSLGITIPMSAMRQAYETAKLTPVNENNFRQLRLNQWVKQSKRWMPMAKWDACDFPVDAKALEGRDCWGGLDLSATTDITAFVLVFPPKKKDGRFEVLPYFWIPGDRLKERVRRDHVPYDNWGAQGLINITEGDVIHYAFVEQFIKDLGKKYNIQEIVFDRWGAEMLCQNLTNAGFHMEKFGQGYQSMSPATKDLLAMVLEGRIAHGGNPVLRWMADNMAVDSDPAGNLKPNKAKATERIDGVVALIMALNRAIIKAKHLSTYRNGRGLAFTNNNDPRGYSYNERK